jgi:hypothetical protein
VILRKNSAVSKVRCIDFNNCRFSGVEVAKDWGRTEHLLEGGERFLCIMGPFELDFFPSKVRKRSCNLAVAFDEPPIEVGETEEYLDIMRRLWAFPTENRFDFGGIHVNTLRGDHEPEKRDFCSMELAFLRLDVETGFLKSLENQTDMALVLFEGIRIDQEIVEVDNEEFIEIVAKLVVHKMLECPRRVT